MKPIPADLGVARRQCTKMQPEDAGVHELASKCPTCGRPKGASCIRLGTVPGNRIMWVQTEPHPARTAARRG